MPFVPGTETDTITPQGYEREPHQGILYEYPDFKLQTMVTLGARNTEPDVMIFSLDAKCVWSGKEKGSCDGFTSTASIHSRTF